MLVQNDDLDLRLKVLEKGKIQIEETKDEEQLVEGESSQLFVNTITKMFQMWQKRAHSSHLQSQRNHCWSRHRKIEAL